MLLFVAEVAVADVTRQGGTSWDAAFDAVLAHNAALVAGKSVSLRPVIDPDGETLAGYVELRTGGDEGGALLDRQLVVGGEVVTWRAGLPTLAAHLKALGFPARLLSRYLLADLLQYFAALPPGFSRGTRASWASLAGATLRADGDGAVLVLPGAAAGEGGGGIAPEHPRRLEVRFDREARARFTVYEDRGAGFVEVPARP